MTLLVLAFTFYNTNTSRYLDKCGEHSGEERGYHYHSGELSKNQIIKCLHGLPGYTEVKE